MKTIYTGIAIFVFFIIVWELLLFKMGKTASAYPLKAYAYKSCDALLTPSERCFFGVLRQAAASDYHIFTKVRLADVVQPAEKYRSRRWWSAFNSIAKKHVDFVLCDLNNLRIVAVIELDDGSHEREDRRARDRFVDQALKNAGISILHHTVCQSYNLEKIREQVLKLGNL